MCNRLSDQQERIVQEASSFPVLTTIVTHNAYVWSWNSSLSPFQIFRICFRILHEHECFILMYVSVSQTRLYALGCQRRVLHSSELELQIIVEHHVDIGN